MFISNAYAQAAATGGGAGGGLLGLLPMAMIDALGKGDEIVSAGGVVGRVTKVGDAYITIEIAEGTEIILQKAAVTLLLPKGTIKTL
nr:preprotein translocase subunit YajC [Oxalobacteraceae bacterium]